MTACADPVRVRDPTRRGTVGNVIGRVQAIAAKDRRPLQGSRHASVDAGGYFAAVFAAAFFAVAFFVAGAFRAGAFLATAFLATALFAAAFLVSTITIRDGVACGSDRAA
jgi:predicted phage tail protein